MKQAVKILVLFLFLSLTACGTQSLSEPPDYADADNWVCMETDGVEEADLFFLCPTLVAHSETGDYASLDESRDRAPLFLQSMASAFQDYTNVYMPLYRMMTLDAAASCNKNAETYMATLRDNLPYQDVTAALDYYFENCNNGKPCILAGHSQGSALLLDVLDDYMEEHPDYLDSMVAAYVLGFAPSAEYMEANPHLSFATGETDTGVIVSWNTEGPGATESSMVLPEHALVINPLNWKTDETYAGAEENRGSLIDGEIVMNYADAKLNLERGVVVCNTEMEYTVAEDIFGDKCLHKGDYALFYNNINENGLTRLQAFLRAS